MEEEEERREEGVREGGRAWNSLCTEFVHFNNRINEWKPHYW